MSKITGRDMCFQMINQQIEADMWGGVAYLHMRTPMFDLGKNKKSGEYTDVKPRMRKYHATQLVGMNGDDGKPLMYKTGENKGKPRMQGVPNPFWDFEADRPKIIKHTLMQVQIGFDWFRIMQSMQVQGGFTPNYAGGTVQTWRAETRFIEVQMTAPKAEAKKTVFFYRENINTETGERKPFNPQRDKIYLSCLRPMKPLASMPTKVWFEELANGEPLSPEIHSGDG